MKDFEPYKNMWLTTSEWLRNKESWMNDPLSSIDPEHVEKTINDSYKLMHKCTRQFADVPSCQQSAQQVGIHGSCLG